MATLNAIDLGTITSESQTKESNLFFFPIPGSDSSSAFLIDLMGTSRTITIEGSKISSTKADMTSFIESIEALQNGNQSAVTYVGDFITTNKSVQIQTFTWNWTEADVGRIKYTLTLLEGLA